MIEAYTCLYRVWKDALLQERLRGLINIFDTYLLAEDGHLKLFFDNDWNCSYDIFSYGHDIEASWLLHESALVLGEEESLAKVEARVPSVVAAATEGFTPEGGMIYEKLGDHIDGDRHWWVQAETVVGYFNLWDHFGSQEGMENALSCWDFIKASLIDKENGGLPSARKAGLDVAEGEYVLFADSDDWLETNAVEKIMAKAHATNADIVYFDIVKEYGHKQSIKREREYTAATRELWIENIFNYRSHGLTVSKCFRRSLYTDNVVYTPKLGMH